MTPKQKVIARNPHAHCAREDGEYKVFPHSFGMMRVWPIASGSTPKEAWKNAAEVMGFKVR